MVEYTKDLSRHKAYLRARGIPETNKELKHYKRAYELAGREPVNQLLTEIDRIHEREALTRMETEADRRAMQGVPEPIVYEGRITGVKWKYSDNLLMFRMKAIAPNKYRERMDHHIDANVRHSGVLKTGGTKSPEEWERDIDELAAKGPPPLPDEGK